MCTNGRTHQGASIGIYVIDVALVLFHSKRGYEKIKCENFISDMSEVNRSEMLKKLNSYYGIQFNFFNREVIKNLT